MTEGRTSVGETDAEVERTSTTSGTTPAGRTDADDATAPAVGTSGDGDGGEPQPGDTVAAATLPGPQGWVELPAPDGGP